MKNGIINVYKPQNMTSHDVVAIMRGVLKTKRIGHTGTLDPMATGVLPVCIGKATRIMDYLEMDIKEYVCSLKLGMVTDTEDIWGEVLEEKSPEGVTEDMVREACDSFHGITEQLPPMYSAVQINGRRLYDYARAGEKVERKTRKIYIESLDLLAYDHHEKTAKLKIRCSKGTYIRTICSDIGQKLGCGAVLSSLERTASGVFVLENSVHIETIRDMNREEAEKLILDTDYPLINFGKTTLDLEGTYKFVNGMRISKTRWEKEEGPVYENRDFPLGIREEYRRAYRVYGTMEDGSHAFLGIGVEERDAGCLKGSKVFFDRQSDL